MNSTVSDVSLLLDADTRTSAEAARQMFASAVDWLLQIGFDTDGKRRVFSLVEVNEHLDGGEVTFTINYQSTYNIVFATHEGDITNDGGAGNMSAVSSYMHRLDGLMPCSRGR